MAFVWFHSRPRSMFMFWKSKVDSPLGMTPDMTLVFLENTTLPNTTGIGPKRSLLAVAFKQNAVPTKARPGARFAVAQGCPRSINGASVTVEVHGIHPPVADIGVVGDRQQRITCFALGVHPVPQRLRVVVIHGAEGYLRNVSAIAEKNVAIVRHGSPLVRTERGG